MVGDEIFQLKDYLIHPYPEIRSAKLHIDQILVILPLDGDFSVDLLVLIKKMLLVACQHELFYTICFNREKTNLIAVKFRGF